ncbi:hypothetical protein AVEN_101884-1 [Araneus ventricosus]|uniref:Uncharacterized protein n=1 Tax=Araneus ventricosus TaxID=182803 RepID=A0A4Y2D5G3_ARAVE|nr:hypothetical protein AVEN_240657-1 [Araneus ventricosus]GBM13022.1 hypothetical protein AVEN_101884-1 [Araneus ventricosus]
MGRHARPTRVGNLLSMRSRKQTERQLLLMESPLAYPRGKEEKSFNSKRRKNSKVEQTLGYLGVVKPVTPKEDVPLRGGGIHEERLLNRLAMLRYKNVSLNGWFSCDKTRK